MIKKLHEIAEAETSRRLKVSQDSFSDAVCSVYAISGVKDYPHLGSASLFSWQDQVFLITAGHLLDSGRQALDIMAQTNRSLKPVSLSRRFIKSDDERDLALCALNPREVESLCATPIDGLNFFKFPHSVNGRSLATIGWPNTKNKLDI